MDHQKQFFTEIAEVIDRFLPKEEKDKVKFPKDLATNSYSALKKQLEIALNGNLLKIHAKGLILLFERWVEDDINYLQEKISKKPVLGEATKKRFEILKKDVGSSKNTKKRLVIQDNVEFLKAAYIDITETHDRICSWIKRCCVLTVAYADSEALNRVEKAKMKYKQQIHAKYQEYESQFHCSLIEKAEELLKGHVEPEEKPYGERLFWARHRIAKIAPTTQVMV